MKGKQENIEIKIEINDNSRNSLSLVWLTKVSSWYGWVSAKKEVMKVLSHTFLERVFCPHSYRWKPYLLRETDFPVQRDFNSQTTTIPLNLHYIWPAGRGENNSKVRHKAIHNALTSHASNPYPGTFCAMDCGHSITTSDCLLARRTCKTPSHPGNHWQYTLHSSSEGRVKPLHTNSGGLFSSDRSSWPQIPSRHFQGMLHRLCLNISLVTQWFKTHVQLKPARVSELEETKV